LSQGSGLSRGDKNRNARLTRLRGLVPVENAVVGIDLADRVQSVVVVDHDSKVLARRRVSRRAWELGPLLEWAMKEARAAGFAGVTVACEPTGHRWRVVGELAAARGMPFVCVQPLLVARAREAEDYTRDKTDEKDAVLIARLTTVLSCYEAENAASEWARLRHLGARRIALIEQITAVGHQVRDLLECCWPAVLSAAAQPLESKNWQAAVVVATAGSRGELDSVAAGGLAAFVDAVRAELPRWGGSRVSNRILRAAFDALTDPTGVAAQRPGALERIALLLDDWADARRKLADAEARMVAVLDALELTQLLASIHGLSPICAAAILAETGDPARFRSSRALVKHAGINPQQNTSGTLIGRSRISKRGRPGLRTAAWRAVWAALQSNTVLAARYQHLTTREKNQLASLQAHIACAGALLRWIHVVVTHRVPWNPAIAAGTPTQRSARAA